MLKKNLGQRKAGFDRQSSENKSEKAFLKGIPGMEGFKKLYRKFT